MLEFLIVFAIVVWSVFAIKNSRKHGCCGDCAKCAAKCSSANANKQRINVKDLKNSDCRHTPA